VSRQGLVHTVFWLPRTLLGETLNDQDAGRASSLATAGLLEREGTQDRFCGRLNAMLFGCCP